VGLDIVPALIARNEARHARAGVPYRDIPVGSFRPLDLTAPPFSFPEPLAAIPEDDDGRHLALWRLDTLPLR
jgi:hypothetical protein